MKSIKARVFDILEAKFRNAQFHRQDVVDAYVKVTGKAYCGRLSTSLCDPCGTQGYFCWATRKEPRYIDKIARNTYVLRTSC